LLVHLSQEQLAKKGAVVVEGEALDVIVGNKPIVIDKKSAKKDKDSESAKNAGEAVKQGVLNVLKDKYGVEEDDFISAELEVVPAGRAREAGLDRSMILAYGHDDKVCAYTSYRAMIDVPSVKRTACCILVDKEEIGSYGATGMESMFFENTVAELIRMLDENKDEGISCDLLLRRMLAKCTMLSSDVSSGFDPLYAQCFDKKNVSFLGKGMVINKFTGARGKSGSNDANAEYVGYIRKCFTEGDVAFQTAELGKVDLGGGGTIAFILAHYGMSVIDSGVAVLNMHAPFEAVSKADVYETKRGYEAFLQGNGKY
ncbi:MAG: aminopeptidase, partial [Eubacterium sp.]|nr:aminopeptidase [Eubacterium sp.]